MKKLLILSILVILSSCSSKKVFPVSNVVPGAEISVKIKKDNNGNKEINLKSRYLTSPERLSPPKSVYLIWMQTESNGLINLGQLDSKVSDKGSFVTVTSYNPLEIFITAEDDATLKYPTGQEISRVKVN